MNMGLFFFLWTWEDIKMELLDWNHKRLQQTTKWQSMTHPKVRCLSIWSRLAKEVAQNSWTSITLLQRYKGVNVVGLRVAFFLRERERKSCWRVAVFALPAGRRRGARLSEAAGGDRWKNLKNVICVSGGTRSTETRARSSPAKTQGRTAVAS